MRNPSRNSLFIGNSHLGDLVFSLGVLRALIMDSERVTVAAPRKFHALFAPMLDRCDSECIDFTRKTYAGHWRKLLRTTWRTRFDRIVDMRCSPISAMLSARQRQTPRTRDTGLVVDQLASQFAGHLPQIHVTDAQIRFAAAFPPCEVVFVPFAGWQPKEWGMAHWLKLGGELTAAGVQVGAVMSPNELARAEDLRALGVACVADPDPLVGAVFAAHARCVVGGDTGMMHAIHAVRAPNLRRRRDSFCLFGPSDERRYGPWHDPEEPQVRGHVLRGGVYDPAKRKDAQHAAACMAAITPQTVLAAIEAHRD